MNCGMRRNLSGKEGGMSAEKTFTVFVVDDDDSVRMALRRLLQANEYQVTTFESAEDFLSSERFLTEGCLVLDIKLPGMSGLELYEKLASYEANYPVVFITAHDNPQWQEQVAKTGAVAFLRKPFDEQALLDALQAAGRRLEEVRTRSDSKN